MLTKLTRGNQITIPKTVIEQAHLKAGSDYLDVEYRDGVISLRPVEVEERIPPEVFEKFQKQMLKKERGDVLVGGAAGEEFLARRGKKSR